MLRWFWPKRRRDIGPSRHATRGCNGQQASNMAASGPASTLAPAHETGDSGRECAGLLRMMIALDGAGDQVDLFFASGVDDEVNETPLDLRPLVTHLVREAVGVFFECLMQHADNKKPPLAP